jgi:hypothetical protein
VQVESLAVRIRPRSPLEAADFGARLCQHSARSVYTCYFAVAFPVIALALASYEISGALPILVLWLAKPWLDRTILFVLSRAAFGQRVGFEDVWREQRSVWWSQLFRTCILQRLAPWRSFTQAVYQLEGLGVRKARKRVLQLRGGGRSGPATLVTAAFHMAEESLTFAVASLTLWLAPAAEPYTFSQLFAGETPALVELVLAGAYALAVLFLEPFYVAAGFAMYLNRRADLEAWDIEQEFRRAFAT